MASGWIHQCVFYKDLLSWWFHSHSWYLLFYVFWSHTKKNDFIFSWSVWSFHIKIKSFLALRSLAYILIICLLFCPSNYYPSWCIRWPSATFLVLSLLTSNYVNLSHFKFFLKKIKMFCWFRSPIFFWVIFFILLPILACSGNEQ